MQSLKNLFLLSILSLLFSCSWVGSYIKQVNNSKKEKTLNEIQFKRIECAIDEKQLTIFAPEMQNTLNDFLGYCLSSNSTSDILVKRCFLNLAIYQLLMRPDLITPYSETFVISQHQEKISYFSSESSNNVANGYWNTLWSLADAWNLSPWFTAEIQKWITNPPVPIKVSKGLSQFLQEKKNLILNNQEKNYYKQLYARGDEIISEGEDLPFTGTLSFLLNNRKKMSKGFPEKFIDIQKLELKKHTDKNLSYQCNFDIQNALEGKVSTYSRPLESAVFAVKYGDFFISLASYPSDKLQESVPNNLAYFFLESPSGDQEHPRKLIDSKEKITPKFCSLTSKNGVSSGSMLLASYEGRDPGQYLASTIHYLKEFDFNEENFQKIMNSPRHLLLVHPLRLAFEVEKANEEQIQNILKMDVPVFNEKYLGHLQYNGIINNKVVYIPDHRGPQDFCSVEKNQRIKK
jgi:hypothetical protein